MTKLIRKYGDDDNRADNHSLDERRDSHHIAAVPQKPHNECTHNRSEDRPLAPKQAPGLSITMFSDVEPEHLPENVDVLLATNNETILSILAEATPQIDGVVLCASEDEVFDYLQSRQANVLALDLGLLGSAALSIARWATSRDPALSILAIDREGTKSDVDQFLAGLNVRYVLGPDDMTPESCCPKLEILVRRAKMLRAMQRGDT